MIKLTSLILVTNKNKKKQNLPGKVCYFDVRDIIVWYDFSHFV